MLGDVDPQQLRIQAWLPVVYTGHDNRTAVRITQFDEALRRDVALDFTAVDRLILTFPEVDPPVSFDSLVLPDNTLDWTQGNGVLVFNLSEYDIPEGIYNAELVAYDAQHDRGQVIVTLQVPRPGLALTFDQVSGDGDLPLPLPADGSRTVRTAGETISALRVVYESGGEVFRLDQASDNVQALLGISVTAAAEGGAIKIQRDGSIDTPGWTWTEGLVFLGADGLLTQTVPTTGWEVVVGYAPTSTRLNIDFDEPVLLA